MSMDWPREGSSTVRPPLLDGTNYPYWKAKMRAFLKSIDERVWLAVINGWTPPTVITGEVTVLKPISAWDRVDYDNCGWNNKVMNAIYNGVTAEEFRRISNCEIAKEAQDILQITHEGTTTVKIAKLQRLTTYCL